MHVITLATMQHILIWNAIEIEKPDDYLKKRLLLSLQATGAICGILISGSTILQIVNTPGQNLEWSTEINQVPISHKGEIVIEHTDIAELLDQYLNKLWQHVSRIFYQAYGESEKDFRNLTILSAIVETLLRKVADEHSINVPDIQKNSLFIQLITLGTAIPQYNQQPGSVSEFDSTVRKTMIETGRMVPVPENLIMYCVDPILMTRGIHRHLRKVKHKVKRKKNEILQESHCESPIISPVFHHMVQDIRRSFDEIPIIIDPFSGNGEIILLFSRYISNQCDNPLSRLSSISSRIYCSDQSPASILIIRFALVLHIFGKNYSEPLLFDPVENEKIAAIRNNVRVGSVVFTTELRQEFLSEEEQRTTEHIYKPLGDDWPDIQNIPAILITCPCNNINIKIPEIKQYLCKHFTSYSQDPAFSTIASEKILSHFFFPAYIFIQKSWLSDAQSEPFRKLIRRNRINRIVIDDDGWLSDKESWTCLVADTIISEITIVRTDSKGRISTFQMDKSDLPEKGGWNLEDPTSSLVLELIRRDSVPLSEYCLGALYHPGEINTTQNDVVWISLIPDWNILVIKSGVNPDIKATTLIRGPDPFLEGLLTSSLLQWYWQRISHLKGVIQSAGVIASLPIRQPDWYNQDENELVKDITACMSVRSSLLHKMEYTRCRHDVMRIQNHLKKIEKERDRIVCRLYRIPDTFHTRFL